MLPDPRVGVSHQQRPTTNHESAALLQSVYTLLDEVVAQLDIDASYKARLHAVLHAAHVTEQTGVPVTLLPLLTCQAAGQAAQQAVPVAAAWRAAIIAAKLLDDVEDGEVAHISADTLSPAQVINVATGLLSVANLVLARLPAPLWGTVQLDFQRTILRSAGGQHADLCQQPLLDLDAYFEVISAKSGACFGFAAGAGAACGSPDRTLIDRYTQFGYNIGVMLQVANDLAGLRLRGSRGDLASGQRTLAVRYGLAVAAPLERARLARLLENAPQDSAAEHQARHLLVSLGAELYLLSEIARYRRRVQAMFAPDQPTPAPVQPLYDWLAALQSSML